MIQQFGIVVAIDTDAALKQGTLDGCIYMYDNMAVFGSSGEGTGVLTSFAHGVHYIDGSQASSVDMNWLASGISNVPHLPKQVDDFEDFEQLSGSIVKMTKAQLKEKLDSLIAMKQPKNKIIYENGYTYFHNSTYSMAQLVDEQQLDCEGLKTQIFRNENTNHLPPVITKITGKAVEKEVMFPTQLGSPDMISDGWYWYASLNTKKVGSWSYTMHITLFQLEDEEEDGIRIWRPVYFEHEAKIKITDTPLVNGFTGAGIGFLKISTK